MLKLPQLPAPLLRAVMPMLLGLSLIGCVTPPAPPVAVCPANPPPPALQEPMPPVSYSLSAERLYKRWRDLLMATPTTPAH